MIRVDVLNELLVKGCPNGVHMVSLGLLSFGYVLRVMSFSHSLFVAVILYPKRNHHGSSLHLQSGCDSRPLTGLWCIHPAGYLKAFGFLAKVYGTKLRLVEITWRLAGSFSFGGR
jgi:hypothetical protein